MAQRWFSIERVSLAAVAAITLWQVLVPPYVGLADNSDFGKIAGRFSLRPPGGVFEHHFVYVVGKYVYDPKAGWNSGILSSELIPAGLAVAAHWMWDRRSWFDIRYLGVMHAAAVVLALWLALPALARLEWRVRAVVCVLVVVTLTDVSYVSYWNSFYMDAAALAFLILVAACGARMAAAPTTANTVLFGVALVLFTGSKLQHALPALVFCVYLAWVRKGAAARAFAVAGAAAAVVLALTSPFFYREKAVFNLVFYEFAAKAPDPRAALLEMGFSERHAVALGMHAFEDRFPANDPGWLEEFDTHVRFRPVVWYYVRHPAQVMRRLGTVMAENVVELRAPNLSNYRAEDGLPPGTLSRRWSLWSAVHERLFGAAPYAVWSIYAAAVWVALVIRRQFRAGCSLMLAFAAFGVAEFLGASLGDVLDTGRHLRLFHAASDFLLLGVAAFVANWSRCLIRSQRLPSV